MNLVSILIPAYNDEEYIGASIESALMQTYPECEVIVVDDGSTDGTVAEVSGFDSVTLITQPNQGAPAARNRALEAASGAYIQFLDADDLLNPTKIEAQVQTLEESPKGTVAVSSTCYFQDGQDPEKGQRAEEYDMLNSDDPVQWLVNLLTPGRGWGMVQTGAWLTPREIVKEAGLWKEYVSPDDDGEYFTRVLLASEGVRYVREGCVYYRQYPDETRVSNLRSKEALRGWMWSIDSKRDHIMPLVSENNHTRAAHGLARQYWSLALSAYPRHSEIAAQAEARAGELGFPEFLRSVSSNGWKGRVANVLTNTLGWRSARWLQWLYHRTESSLDSLSL